MKNYKVKNSDPIKLTKENIAVFFSDGVLEAQSPKGEEFGFDRTLDLIKCQQQNSAQQIVESIYKGILSFSENQPQEDDITAVIFKKN